MARGSKSIRAVPRRAAVAAGILWGAVAARAATGELPLGRWDAALLCPGGRLSFGLELARDGDAWRATVVNGSERIDVPRVEVAGGRLVLGFDHYDATVEASLEPGDEVLLAGEWRKRRGPEEWARLPFVASAAPPAADALGASRTLPSAVASPDSAPPDSVPSAIAASASSAAFAPPVDGRWRVRFASADEPAVAVLATVDGALAGTFLTTTGDFRYLAGAQHGQRIMLSCFDGAHAFLFTADLAADGTLQGDFWSGDRWHETWSATRDEGAALPDGFALTRWTGEQGALGDLAFPDLEGQLRSLDDVAFAGRARILQVFGSWCPNCHDASELLADLDRRYRARGLSIVGLAFEITGDPVRDGAQVRRYGERHGVRYPLLLAGLADKEAASAALPVLDQVRSYPTTIFLHGDGRVAAVHQGFAGPATGGEHLLLRAAFEALIEELLAEGEG